LELGTKAVQLSKKRQGWFGRYMRRRRHRAHHRILQKNTKYGLVRGISSERFEIDATNLARLATPESGRAEPRPPEPRSPEPCSPEPRPPEPRPPEPCSPEAGPPGRRSVPSSALAAPNGETPSKGVGRHLPGSDAGPRSSSQL
jgi:hypothetical protein